MPIYFRPEPSLGGASMVMQRIVNHSDGWTIHVHARDWDPVLQFRAFEFAESGLLLLGKEDQRGLAIRESNGCLYLNFKTWHAERPPPGGKYVSARLWNISLPWARTDVEWLFSKTGPTPSEPPAGA